MPRGKMERPSCRLAVPVVGLAGCILLGGCSAEEQAAAVEIGAATAALRDGDAHARVRAPRDDERVRHTGGEARDRRGQDGDACEDGPHGRRARGVRLKGVNLAGAEFGEGNLPGIYEQDYIYPSAADVELFVERGVNVFRVPFRWERLQQTLMGEFDPVELSRLQSLVEAITSRGATVVLDPHNYARYAGQIVGIDIAASTLGDFWARLAALYAGSKRVAFGLMNEPNSMPTEVWRDAANVAIAAIRATGATNLVLVPGNAWTAARSWDDSWYGTPNAVVMTGIEDPENNFAFDVHQYLDADGSGTYSGPATPASASPCESTIVGTLRLALFTAWARATGVRGFLGEFGVPDDPTCLDAMDDMLRTLDASSDVFLGWTYWAGGPWWGDYPLSVQPYADGTDKPQFSVLSKYLR